MVIYLMTKEKISIQAFNYYKTKLRIWLIRRILNIESPKGVTNYVFVFGNLISIVKKYVYRLIGYA